MEQCFLRRMDLTTSKHKTSVQNDTTIYNVLGQVTDWEKILVLKLTRVNNWNVQDNTAKQ